MNANIENIDDVLYDSCNPVSTATTSTTLFSVAVGSIGNGFTANKTYFHTNMEQQGALANNERFTIFGMTAWLAPHFLADTDLSSMAFINAMCNGFFDVYVANKFLRHIPIPMLLRTDFKVSSPVATKIIVNFKTPFYENKGFVPMDQAITIASSNSIRVDVKWNSAAAFTSNTISLYFGFMGIRTRSLQ